MLFNKLDLIKEIKKSDSYWTLEDDELIISLSKVFKADTWDGIFVGHK